MIPPFLSAGDRAELAKRIDIDSSLFVELRGDTDPFTSSVPFGLQHAWQHRLVESGDVVLLITVGSGLQVGCTTYRF